MQATGTAPLPPRVFISYSHDSLEHMERVKDFANKLRTHGIDSVVDRYFEDTLKIRWSAWMEQEIDAANFVLVVATPGYLHRQKPGEAESGGGVNWEGAIITEELYAGKGLNSKFYAVYFGEGDRASIPLKLRGFSHYDISSEEGYRKLYRRLINRPEVVPPEISPIIDPVQLYFSPPPPPAAMSPRQEAVKERIEALGNAYQELRQSTLPSEIRTQKMSILAAKMRALASDAYFLLDYLAKNPAPGHRLAAVSLLAVYPNPEYLEWLSERLAPEKPFVGYHAARALQSAARVLGAEFHERTRRAIDDAVRRLGTGLENTDRADALREARQDLRITEELVRELEIPDSPLV